MKNEITASRSSYLDNIKGILIFLVVFTHCLFISQENSIINFIVDIVYMFHMPVFVFITGYLSKSDNARSALSLVRLGVCYVIFNLFLMYAFYPYSMGALTPYNSMWYVLAVIVWRAAAASLSRNRYIVPILIAAAFTTGLWSDIDNTLAVARIICFSPFFMAGYTFDKDKLEKLENKKTLRTYFVGLISLALAIVIGTFALLNLDYTDHELQWGNYNSANDVFERIILFIVAVLFLIAILCLVTNKKIPFINQIGKNSLSVYLCHRPLTLIYSSNFGYSDETGKLILLSFAASLLIVLIFGADAFSSLLNKFIDCITNIITGKNKSKLMRAFAIFFAVIVAVSPLFTNANLSKFIPYEEKNDEQQEEDNPEESSLDVIHRIMSADKLEQYENAFRIVFAGDIILLEDQVKNGYTGDFYDFSDLFEYTEKYISSADLAIGVFEGPMGGEEAGFSTSNYDDGKELYLNYPDELAYAVKDAGFDLVTTANNHLLDKGEKAAHRTIDVLESIRLEHTGSYRNADEKEKEHVKIVEMDEIRFAVLSYTYGSNNYTEEDFINGELSYITSILADPEGENFEYIKEQVKGDFEKAKSYEPDFMIVLSHMGTQFLDEPDEYQKTWCNIFKEYGADIILSDHTHSVQPAIIEELNGKNVFTAYCPGNYTNIYRKHNGDASSLVEVYIDRETKEIIGGGIVPMWICSMIDGNYRPIPVHDVLTDEKLRNSLTTDDLDRVKKISEHISSVMFGTKLGIDLVGERCYFDLDGFMRLVSSPLELTEEMESSSFLSILKSADKVCFIGDSVTEGTKNGGCPWYEPLIGYCNDIRNCSWGGGTVSTLIDNLNVINEDSSDLYVIAIGTNDVRYRDDEICAMTSEEYVKKINTFVNGIHNNNEAQFVFIAPWISTDGDPFCEMKYSEKIALNSEYSSALKSYCDDKGYMFVDANSYINDYITRYPSSYYLLDHIHPNFKNGIRLYSEAVILSSDKVE